MRANQLAVGCGDLSLHEILAVDPQVDKKALCNSEDITLSLFQVEKKEGPPLPSSSSCLPKAAVFSFQTWHTRAPGIVGILLGVPKKKGGDVCCSVIVGTSFGQLFEDSKVETICSKDGMHICGVIFAGVRTNQQDYDTAVQWTSHILSKGCSPVTCVMATWNVLLRMLCFLLYHPPKPPLSTCFIIARLVWGVRGPLPSGAS